MKIAILIRIEQETKEKLKELAKSEKRSLNSLINKVLSDFGGHNGSG